MQRRVFLLLGLLLAAPLVAQANLISLQGGPVVQLTPNTAGQVITLLLTGDDLYSSSDFKTQINGGVGPAPFVTAVFGDTNGGAISPASLLNGTIWAGGAGAGVEADPNNISNGVSTGLTTGGGAATAAFFGQNTNGIYLTLTLSTVGVPAGQYALTFDGTIMDYYDEEFNVFPVPLQFAPMTLSIVPEPSSVVLGLFAAAGMAAVVIRRRRAA
jgi:hypothetical protein